MGSVAPIISCAGSFDFLRMRNHISVYVGGIGQKSGKIGWLGDEDSNLG